MLKNSLKRIVRSLGFEVKRYNLNNSQVALIGHLLKYYNIDLVFDVGANEGQYARFLRECQYTDRIVSFEPLSSARSRLVAASRNDPRWEIAPQVAIGDREGEITINISENSLSSSVLPMLDTHLKAAPESAFRGSEVVRLSRLDIVAKDYLKDDDRAIFLKIDVQGFEKQAIEGAAGILPRVKGIQLELSLVPLYEGQVLWQEMLDLLQELGFSLYSISPVFNDPETGRALQIDGVFFKS
ncbi:FkbM family methyltransferase [Pannus brasiliensis CCIBt3594]|uniref:FkbM family methyltransferase n=1 Tax=Pannus brasiliensis CCIBt3594 TaxID=1427578 RepID=A0AAW9QLS3_9CHRO